MKHLVPIHVANYVGSPGSVQPGFKKFYLKNGYFKLYDGTNENDVVLDRPLDGFVAAPGTITPADTVLTALEKLDYAISNVSTTTAWGSITGTITAQGDLISYLSSSYYPLTANPAGYLTQQSVLEFPTFSSFPLIGASDTIYIAVDTDLAYYWDGVSYQIVTTSVSGITGFGTVNTLPKFTPTGSQLGNSRFTDNGATGRYGTASNYVEFLNGNTFLRLLRSQATFDIVLGNPQISQELILDSTNNFGNVLRGRAYWAFRVGALGTTEALRLLSTGQLQLPQTPATGTTSDFLLLRDSTGNLKQIAYPTIPIGTVTGVTATSPITSSGGATPNISTSMNTNKLIGRSTAGVGVMEEITVGTGLTLSGGTLNATAQTVGFEQNFLLMGS